MGEAACVRAANFRTEVIAVKVLDLYRRTLAWPMSSPTSELVLADYVFETATGDIAG